MEPPIERLLPWHQLAEIVPYSRQHVARLERAGQFPRRVRVGPGRVAWRASEVQEWIESRRRGGLEIPAQQRRAALIGASKSR
jgi:prophage regulatory protein